MGMMKQAILKALVSHKSLREVSRMILKVALKNDTLREIIIDITLDCAIKPSENIFGNLLNLGKEKQIRKIFTEEQYRETALDYIEKILEHEQARNLLISAIEKHL